MNICRECRLLIREWLISALALYSFAAGLDIPFILWLAVASLPVFSSFGFITIFPEILSIALPVYVFSFFTDNSFAAYLPFACGLFMILSYRSGKIWTFLFSLLFVTLWVWAGTKSYSGPADAVLIACGILTALGNLGFLRGGAEKSDKIDIFYLSFSGNAKKAAEIFRRGAEEEKAQVRAIDVSGSSSIINVRSENDAAIVFPVHLFAPPSGFLRKIKKELPRGTGKKVFILYSADFYADMAYVPLWAALLFKGYKVMGRYWSASALFKIKAGGAGRSAENGAEILTAECGGDFAAGWRSGLPLIIIPSPLFIISLGSKLIKKRKKALLREKYKKKEPAAEAVK